MREAAKLRRDLKRTVKAAFGLGQDAARAERNYKVLLAQESLKLHGEGMPVGLIDKVIYGVESVADARMERDIAEARYKACQEAINSLKIQLRMIDNQIDREWHSDL